MDEDSIDSSRDFRKRRRIRFWWMMGIAALAAGILLKVWLVRREMNSNTAFVTAEIVSPASHAIRDLTGADDEILKDSRFWITSNQPPPWLTSPVLGLSQFKRREYEARWKLETPRPALSTLGGGGGGYGQSPCSISGLLGQCTGLTGVRFAIEKEVASGSVDFAAGRPLNGARWVNAFTDALQTNTPSVWDSHAHGFRNENLVLLSKSGRTVLVLPKSMEAAYRQKGFKDFQWGFPKELLDTPAIDYQARKKGKGK